MNHQLREETTRDHSDPRGGHSGHGSSARHWLVMFACCVPMVLIVGFLYLTGAVGFGFVLAALVCVAMMPLMHGAMPHGGAEDGGRDDQVRRRRNG